MQPLVRHHDSTAFRVLAAASVLWLSGCATSGGSTPEDPAAEPVRVAYDPWEPLNRGLYKANDVVDRFTLRPVAIAYKTVVPEFMRRGVTNFSQNLFAPRSSLNNFLQGKPTEGLSELGRFIINSTAGVGGLFDVASATGVEKHDEDFGQTFAVWGIPEGPYTFIPVLGPNTLLDAVSIPLNLLSDPLAHYDNSSVRDKIYILRAINLRSRLLSAETLLEDSKDPYITIRESYLQNRQFQIHDGDPPSNEEEDALFDEFFDEE